MSAKEILLTRAQKDPKEPQRLVGRTLFCDLCVILQS
jgi:hypothetical protein